MDGVKRLGKRSIRPKHAITGDTPKMHAITWKPRDLKPKPTQIPFTGKQTGNKKKPTHSPTNGLKTKPKRTQVPVVKMGPKQKPKQKPKPKPVDNGKLCKNAVPCIF